MCIGIWENLNFNFNEFTCVSKGFLRTENGSFLLFRDDKGKLKLKVEGVVSNDLELNRKSGYIEKNQSLIIFEHKFLKQKILMYALPIQQTHSLVGNNPKYTDILIVDEIVFEDSHEQTGAEYLIEFIDNFKINHIFPHLMKLSENHERIFEIYGSDCQLIQKIVNAEHSNRNSIGFIFEGSKVYIVKIKDGDKGIILYKKNLESDKREKIRRIISYILGCPLIFYGYTFVNLMQELYVKYEEYDLGNIFLTYWIAVNSNSITAAVHYGALIEKLQATYMKIHEVSYSKILDKAIFKKMRERLQKQLEEFELTPEQKRIFLDKIGNLNTYSQKDRMYFFCNDISLSLSDNEKTAWQQRNDAAHGNDITDVNQAWKNTLILKELLNRFLLKILTSSIYYLSYVDGDLKMKRL